MPRINTRAIAKLQEAEKALKKLGRNSDTTAGQAFARDLIATLEKGKPAVLTIGDESVNFKPDDVRVSNTKIMIGDMHLGLAAVRKDENGNYTVVTLVDDVNLLGETQKITLAPQEFAVAA